MLLSAASLATVVLFAFAIFERVSPLFIVTVFEEVVVFGAEELDDFEELEEDFDDDEDFDEEDDFDDDFEELDFDLDLLAIYIL